MFLEFGEIIKLLKELLDVFIQLVIMVFELNFLKKKENVVKFYDFEKR